MRTFADLRLLGDQIVVRCLGTADMQGRIHIPASAQEGRKIHQSGGDYLHRGEVVAVGPGDKTLSMACVLCVRKTDRIPRRTSADAPTFTVGKCHACGGALKQRHIHFRSFMPPCPPPLALFDRAAMPVSVGDTILYENRRDAQLQPRRFPSLGLDEDAFVVLLAEQHVLAVLEPA